MRAVLVLVVAIVTTALPLGAQLVRGELGPRAIGRTEPYVLRAGDGLIVTPSAGAHPDFVMSIEVYDDSKTLVGRDDDEVDSSSFEWEAPRDGRFYVVVRNLSEASGGYVVRIAPSGRSRSPRPPPTHAVVKVFYATNRTTVSSSSGSIAYGAEVRPEGALSVGTVKVSVPRDHRMGEVEGPSILRLEFRSDPERHITVLDTRPQKDTPFLMDVSAAASRSPRREAFVFVHGIATSFEDAARRTAQIAYDLGFEGAPIFYSWPSQGKISLIDYNRDGRNAELSWEGLHRFLEQLAATEKVQTIHVIAHSMGNRVVAAALDAASRTRPARILRLQEVALLAPDIDAQAFRGLAARIKDVPRRVTLYASSGDEALRASRTLVGYPRAGQGGADIVVLPGVDTIDASQVDTSVLGFGHSYYADNRTILSDLFYLIRGQPPRDRVGLQQKQHANGVYWEFRPAVR